MAYELQAVEIALVLIIKPISQVSDEGHVVEIKLDDVQEDVVHEQQHEIDDIMLDGMMQII